MDHPWLLAGPGRRRVATRGQAARGGGARGDSARPRTFDPGAARSSVSLVLLFLLPRGFEIAAHAGAAGPTRGTGWVRTRAAPSAAFLLARHQRWHADGDHGRDQKLLRNASHSSLQVLVNRTNRD